MKKFITATTLQCSGPFKDIEPAVGVSIRYFEDGSTDIGCSEYVCVQHKCKGTKRTTNYPTCLHDRSDCTPD